MDIKTQFILQLKLTAYHTPRFYLDTRKKRPNDQLKRSMSKKISIFDEHAKIHAQKPGPANYITNPQNKLKQKYRHKNKIQIEKGGKVKYTYLDPLLKRSQSLPSVGKYNHDISQFGKSKKKLQRQLSVNNFRPTVFDTANRDTINISPGMYNVRQNLLQKNLKYSIQPQPKKQISLPKIPSPVDYNPIPSSYSTFEKRSLESLNPQSKKTTFGMRIKQKIKQKSPGPIYNLITDWGKKKSLKSQFNLYKSVSLAPKKGIYHSYTHL